MERRVILHSDANAFYASVECALNPALRGKAVAVCGSTENRHGIVLAKSELAKRAGVKTGMANWQAKALCRDLIFVSPRHDIYAQFSERLREIYARYTDYIEPFGLDECWLDVTARKTDPRALADEIRERVKAELGITVSVGISFNKVFAKLGSDLKKPDAVTEITRENFREKIWRLPCSELLYCGRATTEKFAKMGIKTIGDLAVFPRKTLFSRLGKNGDTLWRLANGLDDSPVTRLEEWAQAKSVGHGITCVADLETAEEVKGVIVALAQDVGQRLRAYGLQARGIQMTVRDSALAFHSWQKQLPFPTQCAADLADAGAALVNERYGWAKKIRAVTVSAISLERADTPYQPSLFDEEGQRQKRKKIECALDGIRERFGQQSIRPAVLLCDNKLPEEKGGHAVLPRAQKSKKP